GSGDRAVQRVLLDGVAAGDTILTAAVREPSDPMPPAPATTAGNTVSGVKIGVPYGAAARWILVPASFTWGAGVAVVDPSAGGVTRIPGPANECTLRLHRGPLAPPLGGGPAGGGPHPPPPARAAAPGRGGPARGAAPAP